MKTKRTKKSEQSIINALVKSIKGMVLAEAFVTVKSTGVKFQVVELDGQVYKGYLESEGNRIAVQVSQGVVKKAWVG